MDRYTRVRLLRHRAVLPLVDYKAAGFLSDLAAGHPPWQVNPSCRGQWATLPVVHYKTAIL